MKKFVTIDISGDAGIRAFGQDLKELFVNAATGMYSLITDLNSVRETSTVEIAAENISVGGLLVSWLNELIFNFDAHGFIGKKIVVTGFESGGNADDYNGKGSVRALLTGEVFDPERHEGKLLIKAATYHKLKVEKTGGEWVAEVIFDI